MDIELFKQLSEDPGMIDRVLNPGSYIHEVAPSDLQTRVVPSGFPTMDHDYLFLKDGELVVVAGLPSMGKTAFMFQIAQFVSSQLPVHVFSLEMNRQSVVRRMLSPIIGQSITAIQRGLVPEDLLKQGLDKLSTYDFFIDDRSGLSVDEICDAVRNRYRKHKTRLVIIDYLQIMSLAPGHSRSLEIGVATVKLKALAKELNCPVIIGSQLNRQSVLRGGDMKPMLTDLKESGSIEADADVVVAIHRAFRYTGIGLDDADILILKNRNGACGELKMKFHAARTEFEDIGSAEI